MSVHDWAGRSPSPHKIAYRVHGRRSLGEVNWIYTCRDLRWRLEAVAGARCGRRPVADAIRGRTAGERAGRSHLNTRLWRRLTRMIRRKSLGTPSSQPTAWYQHDGQPWVGDSAGGGVVAMQRDLYDGDGAAESEQTKAVAACRSRNPAGDSYEYLSRSRTAVTRRPGRGGEGVATVRGHCPDRWRA